MSRPGITVKPVRGRDITVLPEHLYPAEEWRIIEARYSDRFMARAETVMALSNGFLGMRGTHDEGRPARSPGTLINGFHEAWAIRHAEEAYGLARTGQSIIEVPDATVLQLYIDDEPLFVPSARIRQYERALDLREGLLVRTLLWSTPGGKHVRIVSRRLASLEYRHLAAISYEVTMLDHAAPVAISSQRSTGMTWTSPTTSVSSPPTRGYGVPSGIGSSPAASGRRRACR